MTMCIMMPLGLDEFSMGTGPPPAANVAQQHEEQKQLHGRVEEIVRSGGLVLQ